MEAVEKIGFLSGGKKIILWHKESSAKAQAASLARGSGRTYVCSLIPGHGDLWYVSVAGSRAGAVDAKGSVIPPETFERWERQEFDSLMASRLKPAALFKEHCATWFSIDPLDLVSLGVPEDEYSRWAARTFELVSVGASLEAFATALAELYTDWDAGEISAGRALELAQVFLKSREA